MPLTCKECSDTNLEALVNGFCVDCHRERSAAWRKKMAIRQNPAQFHMPKLLALLLTQHWMHECQIIPDYMPQFPREDTKPTCQVCFTNDGGTQWFIRYSNGPLQGYFWDIYGDDLHSPEMALIAISKSIAPPGAKTVPTHGSL